MNAAIRILITGATGFTGRHLSQLALETGATLFGLARGGEFVRGVNGWHGDITGPDLESHIARCRPDWIFHLAGLVHGSGAHEPAEVLRVNIEGTRRLLEAARKHAPHARILVAGSSGVYGKPSNPVQPISEETRLQPRSIYAVSKAAQDMLASQYFFQHGLHVVRTRTFNQTGPGEPPGLLCSGLARQIARIEAGLQEPEVALLRLGTRRDFCDVRDVVAGYWAALQHGIAAEVYNICSGRSHSVDDVFQMLCSHSAAKQIHILETAPVPAAGEVMEQVGDPSRLKLQAGWTPRISLDQSLDDLLKEWRGKVGRGE